MTADREQQAHAPTLQYAPEGLIGVLLPQANTTVEPELAILRPPGVSFLAARMRSNATAFHDRIVAYTQAMDDHKAQFATAPLDVVAYAMTGSSYLIGRDAEDAMVGDFNDRHALPLVTAARAICAALDGLGVKRLALVSPYDTATTELSVAYWQSRGFAVVDVAKAVAPDPGFHPIYVLRDGDVTRALDSLDAAACDAVLLLGTGMPTLGTIAARARTGGIPVLSSMLCLVWAARAALPSATPPPPIWPITEAWPDRLDLA